MLENQGQMRFTISEIKAPFSVLYTAYQSGNSQSESKPLHRSTYFEHNEFDLTPKSCHFFILSIPGLNLMLYFFYDDS